MTGGPPHHSPAATRHRTAADGLVLAAGFAAAAALAVLLAFLAPMSLSVFGLAILGLLHVALELRYVIGRFSARISQVLGLTLVLTLTLVVLARAIGMVAPQFARPSEIVAGAIVVGVGITVGLPRRWRTPTLAALAVVVALALWQPGWYFYALTHVHNLIPLVFLWDWAVRHLPRGGARAAFVGAQLLWIVVLPAVVLSGLVDPLVNGSAGLAAAWVGDGSGMLAASAPPGAGPIVAERHLLVFAAQQTMHYVVWIGFFPLFGRDAARAFDARFPLLRGMRVPAIALALSAALLAVFALDYYTGRTLYGLVAAYHVYIEFPVLIMLLAGAGELGAGDVAGSAGAGDVVGRLPG